MNYHDELMRKIRKNSIPEEEIRKLLHMESHCSNLNLTKVNCDYCQSEIYLAWDEGNWDNYWPYQGTSAIRSNLFKYSPMIQSMRKMDDLYKTNWIQSLGNSHTLIHSEPPREDLRFSKKSVKILCNTCFRKTYNRYIVDEGNGQKHAISVVENQTPESICKELGISGTILGKGSINDYI